ncbi:V-type ATP synthase subunit I [Lachnoclostridium sp. Marseille-P6806]|uniref:V-type ATP synthase subunit I n=1 Tax=Lachnoclostridium sp. Marseille-P6806 TaxID=2364793 RepID=UPI00102F4725|nr:V-type ATP synthase subunit I [Lachnoclostridium sp. Marseille-P6806]
MSVLPMKRIVICALRKDRKQVLELLQRQGVLEIRSSLSDDEVFSRQDKSRMAATFRKSAEACEQALTVLDEHAPEESGLLSMLDGRKPLSTAEYEERLRTADEAVRTAKEINSLQKRCSDVRAEIPRTESQLVAIRPWIGYDLPLDFSGTKAAAVFAGTLPGELTQEQIEAALAEYAPGLDDMEVNLISAAPEQTCLCVICGRKHEAELRDALRRMNFAKPPVASENPEQALRDLESRMAELQAEAGELAEQIRGFAGKRDALRFASDYYTMRADKYDVISGLVQSRLTVIIEGYAEARCAESLERALTSRYELVFETQEPAEEEEVPVALRNGGFAAPVESVVESYSLPGRHEFDPSVLVSVFYYFLFGLMLSDAGYGIIMTIGCAYALLKKKSMEPAMKKTMKMFLYCGISTTFWGFMFGSFFGDAVNVIASTFFGRPDVRLPALWFEQIDDPMKMLVFCFVVGIIHMFVGLGAKAWGYLRSGQPLDAVYDVLFWYLLVGGSIGYLLTLPMMSQMLGVKTLSASVGTVAGTAALIGLAGIILTGGRESGSWFKRILKGLYAAYGITGWLSDILSYSRLLALGLATGVIAQVFNKMGSMVAEGAGIIGAVIFIVIFLIGHVLNLAINALGAYVHTNRLEYVEFFGKFYDGGGRAFEPFAQNTKYFKIKEEI